MPTRDFLMKVKALTDDGTFTGMAASYDNVDFVGDRILHGAFKQSIAQQGAGFPLLWAHKQDQPIGIGKVSDSAAGLVVDGTLLMDDPIAKRAHMHMKAQTVRGLSIGYSLPYGEGKIAWNDDGTRTLKEIRLHEISLVATPADPHAQVVSVKSLDQVEHLLRGFRPDDAKDDVLMHLRAIDVQLKRLLKKDALCQCDCAECAAGNCADCSNPDCEDPNCEGSVGVEEMAALKQLAVSLKSLAA